MDPHKQTEDLPPRLATLHRASGRRMKPDALEHPGNWLRVWRMYAGSCDPHRAEDVKGPEPQKGAYVRVWQREGTGKWLLVADVVQK